jgi:putative flippase GtrA
MRFAAVGVCGFAIDVAAFLVLVSAEADVYLARAASTFLAVTATWWLNKEWTFRAPGEAARQGTYLAYLGVQSGGAAINYGAFAAVHVLSAGSSLHPVVAVMAGSAAALFFNFVGARGIVFRRIL